MSSSAPNKVPPTVEEDEEVFRGPRTGVTLARKIGAATAAAAVVGKGDGGAAGIEGVDDLEDPAELFATAQSPNNNKDGDEEEEDEDDENEKIDALEKGEPKKPKKQTRFSLGPNANGDGGEDAAIGSRSSLSRANHPARQMARGKAAAKATATAAGSGSRESWDPDLSSVSTAAASVRENPEEEEDDDDDGEEAAEDPAEKDAAATAASPAEVLRQKAKSGTDESDKAVDEALPEPPSLPGDSAMEDLDEPDGDDDLVPPPPPMDPLDFPDADVDDDDDEEMEEEDAAAAATEKAKSPKDDSKKRPSKSPKNTDTVDYNDDDDKEGDGFAMMQNDDDETTEEDDPGTPASVKEKRLRKQERMELLSKKKKGKETKSKLPVSRKQEKPSKKRKAATDDEDDDVDEEVEAITPAPKKARKTTKKFNRFATKFSPKGVPLPRTFKTVPVSDYKAGTPDDPNLRRSTRARTKPLEFWRGEKQEYGPNNFGDEYDGVKNMPVVVSFTRPEPTPYKKRTIVPPKKKTKKKGDAAAAAAADVEDDMTPLDPSDIAVDYEFNDGKVAVLWDEQYQESRAMKVASQFATMTANSLPVAKSRKKSQGKVVAKAAQAFQMSYEDNPVYPGYIVGHLVLPPRGIKDAESVGLCAQIFTVIKCQPGSLELAYGDPDRDEDTTENWVAAEDGHFLLSPGDAFLVPPGNTYRLQNHSKTTDCTASWVIIRHNQHAMPEDE